MDQNGTNPGLFHDFGIIWVSEPNSIEICVPKSPGFVPFVANMTHFRSKSIEPAGLPHGGTRASIHSCTDRLGLHDTRMLGLTTK